METFTIEVSERPHLGKGSANRCRREGFIPAVAYHRHQDAVPVQVPFKEFTALAQKARRTQVFTFKSSSPTLNGRSVIVKDIQTDYVKNKPIHVDFLTLKDDEEITVDVAIKLVGEAPGVKVQNGVLTFVTHELAIKCLPKNIPTVLEVDITSLNLNESIHATDLTLPAGVELVDPETTIVSVVASRQTEEESASADAAPAADAAKAAAPAAKPAAGKSAK